MNTTQLKTVMSYETYSYPFLVTEYYFRRVTGGEGMILGGEPGKVGRNIIIKREGRSERRYSED